MEENVRRFMRFNIVDSLLNVVYAGWLARGRSELVSAWATLIWETTTTRRSR
jgi:hypothetical protein